MYIILFLVAAYVDRIAAQPEDDVTVHFMERGTMEEPKNFTICQAEGWLFNLEKDVLEQTEHELRRSTEAVEVSCDESECERQSFSQQFHDWVAILHYPDITALKQTTIIDQVRQAILWGASAVIMLAINAETLKKVEIDQALTKPVVIISANITKILKALANSTRVLVALSRPVMSVVHDKSQLGFSTLTLWATCGRMSSRTLSEEEHPFPWEGTVCMDVPAGKSNPSELCAMFYAVGLIFCLLILLKAGRTDGVTVRLALRRRLLLERAQIERRQSVQRALDAIPCIQFRSVSNVMSSRGLNFEETCAICLENYTPTQVLRYLPCKHMFHQFCVDTWLLEQHTCPLCKRNVTLFHRYLKND